MNVGIKFKDEFSKFGVKVFGIFIEIIIIIEDWEMFVCVMEEIGEKCVEFVIVVNLIEVIEVVNWIGFFVIVWVVYVFGGLGFGFVKDVE